MAMNQTGAYVTATLAVLVLLLVGAFAWYHNPGKWVKFEYKGGQPVTFKTGGAPVNRLRFKGVVFYTASPDGQRAAWDVSAVLNGMAAAYDIKSVTVTELSLGGSQKIALNPFSFKKPGFNTTAEVPTAAASAKWGAVPAASTALTGMVRVV